MVKRVTCRECGKELGVNGISFHLKKIHNQDYQDYLHKWYDKYPGDFPRYVRCPICNKLTIGVTCSYECTSEYQREDRSKRVIGTKNPACQPGMSKKLSDGQKRYIEKNGGHRTGAVLTDETKQKISKSMMGKMTGEKNPMYGKTHTPEAIEKIFKHKPMNKLEKRVADVLDDAGIEYTFQFFINKDGVCKSYDFKIKDKDIIIEVDGDYWHGGPGIDKYHDDVEQTKENDKLKTIIAEDRGYKVYRFWESELNKDISVILEKVI